MARSWVGLTILACLPCMVPLRSTEARYSYANFLTTEECYRLAVVSSKNACQTCSSLTLRHKERFPYECLRECAITCGCMHVHAVLSSFKASKLSTTEERMTRWLHRLDA